MRKKEEDRIKHENYDVCLCIPLTWIKGYLSLGYSSFFSFLNKNLYGFWLINGTRR